jgi:hypothetical protein
MWKLVSLILIAFIVCGDLGIEDGYSDCGDAGFEVCRNPVCQSNSYVNVTIIYPPNGTKFFLPHVTPNVTFDLFGGTNPYCYYRLSYKGNTYLYNNWTDCGNGGNETNHKLITLPEGQPVIIEVRVDDNCGVAYAYTYVDVYYYDPNGNVVFYDDVIAFAVLCLFILSALVYAGGRKRNKKRKQSFTVVNSY